jgi:predicted O-methyltransferase YrrM
MKKYQINSYLPNESSLCVSSSLRKGRSVQEGYQRGWGLQYGRVRESILSDPLYVDAFALAEDRTIMSEPNRMNIFLLLRFFLQKIPFGHIIEYGAFRGGNAIFMAYIAQHLLPDVKIYALDTFAGMPATDKDIDAHNVGDFSNNDLESLEARVNELGLSNLKLVKGLFENTSNQILLEAETISLSHIDCDISSAVRYSYDSVKSRLVNGGYVVFDDATVSSCIGATEAVEDLLIRRDGLNSEQIWPHFVFRVFK